MLLAFPHFSVEFGFPFFNTIQNLLFEIIFLTFHNKGVDGLSTDDISNTTNIQALQAELNKVYLRLGHNFNDF